MRWQSKLDGSEHLFWSWLRVLVCTGGSDRWTWRLGCKRFITGRGALALTTSPRLVMRRLRSKRQTRRSWSHENFQLDSRKISSLFPDFVDFIKWWKQTTKLCTFIQFHFFSSKKAAPLVEICLLFTKKLICSKVCLTKFSAHDFALNTANEEVSENPVYITAETGEPWNIHHSTVHYQIKNLGRAS